MSFTTSTITHVFTNADGTPASGAIEFTLTKRMSQPGSTIVPSSLTSALDSGGNLSQGLTSTQDAATVPQDAQWRVDFRILGASVETFFIIVPPGPGTVDLYDLLPAQPDGG